MVRLPVYFDLNGIHQIAIFEEMDDGTFRRTSENPIRLLRDKIDGIGSAVGELVSRPYDREERVWHSPTVVFGHRPYSFYHFLREQHKQRKIYVLSRVSRINRIARLQVHELKLKPTASVQVRALLSKKLIEAIDLDPDHETVLTTAHAQTIA
jgi:hypothetical protein